MARRGYRSGASARGSVGAPRPRGGFGTAPLPRGAGDRMIARMIQMQDQALQQQQERIEDLENEVYGFTSGHLPRGFTSGHLPRGFTSGRAPRGFTSGRAPRGFGGGFNPRSF